MINAESKYVHKVITFNAKQEDRNWKVQRVFFCNNWRIERTRWDEPIEVPLILYQKLNVSPPVQSNNQPQNQVSKHYPPSLIEFIRKAYSRCKDQTQKNVIEAELKDIIEKNKNNLSDINWDNYPLPNIAQSADTSHRSRVLPQQYATSFSSPSTLTNPSMIAPKIIQK